MKSQIKFQRERETIICFQSLDKERETESLKEKPIPINPLTHICKRLKREKDEIP